jgi:hypothetical protein
MQGTGVNPEYNAATAAVGGNQTAGFQYGMADAGAVDQSKIAGAQMPNMSVDKGENYMQNMQDAYWNQAKSRLDPQWNQRQADTETQLQNMGLTRGSEAWNREAQNMSMQRNDAYGGAMNSAILNSGAEAQRRQGMDIAAGNFGNQATQQNFENDLTSQQAFNAAQQQKFGQNQAGAQLNNDALSRQQAAGQGWKSIEAQNNASQAGLAAAQAQAGATMGAAQLNAANQARSIQNQERLQDFNMGWDMQFNPYKLQNLAMGGMSPGDPNFSKFDTPGTAGYQQGQASGQQAIGTGIADAAGGIANADWGKFGNWASGLGGSPTGSTGNYFGGIK